MRQVSRSSRLCHHESQILKVQRVAEPRLREGAAFAGGWPVGSQHPNRAQLLLEHERPKERQLTDSVRTWHDFHRVPCATRLDRERRPVCRPGTVFSPTPKSRHSDDSASSKQQERTRAARSPYDPECKSYLGFKDASRRRRRMEAVGRWEGQQRAVVPGRGSRLARRNWRCSWGMTGCTGSL